MGKELKKQSSEVRKRRKCGRTKIILQRRCSSERAIVFFPNGILEANHIGDGTKGVFGNFSFDAGVPRQGVTIREL